MPEYDTQWFASRRAKNDERPQLRPQEVLSREWLGVDALSARTKLGKLARTLRDDGWEVHVGVSCVFTGDTYVKSTGQVKPGRGEKYQWISAANRDTRQLLLASRDGVWINGVVSYEY